MMIRTILLLLVFLPAGLSAGNGFAKDSLKKKSGRFREWNDFNTEYHNRIGFPLTDFGYGVFGMTYECFFFNDKWSAQVGASTCGFDPKNKLDKDPVTNSQYYSRLKYFGATISFYRYIKPGNLPFLVRVGPELGRGMLNGHLYTTNLIWRYPDEPPLYVATPFVYKTHKTPFTSYAFETGLRFFNNTFCCVDLYCVAGKERYREFYYGRTGKTVQNRSAIRKNEYYRAGVTVNFVF